MKKLRQTLKHIMMFGWFVVVLLTAINAEAFFVYEKFQATSTEAYLNAQVSTSSSNSSGISGPSSQHAQWLLAHHAIVCYSDKQSSSSFIFDGQNVGDCLIDVRVNVEAGSQAGLMMHYQNESNYYKLILDRATNHIILVKDVDGVITTLDSMESDFLRDNNKVFVDVYQDEIVVFVNDYAALLAKDSSLLKGRTGFFAANAQQVVFDSPVIEYKNYTDSVLNHLNDIVGESDLAIDFPVLIDKVRMGDIVLSALEMPEGATFQNGNFTWQPGVGQTGDYPVVFQAMSRDGSETEQKRIVLTIVSSVEQANAYSQLGESNEQQGGSSGSGSGSGDGSQDQGGGSQDQGSGSSGSGSSGTGTNGGSESSGGSGNVDYSGMSSPLMISGGGTLTPLRTTPLVQEQSDSGEQATPPAAPTVPSIVAVTEGLITLNWSDSSATGATIYLLEQSYSDLSFSNPIEYWETGTSKSIRVSVSGTYYFRVRAFTAHRNEGGIGSDPSSVVHVSVSISAPLVAPNTPSITTVPDADFDGKFALSWSNQAASGATVYCLEQSLNSDTFTSAVKYWVYDTTYSVSIEQSGVYYFRVTAYTGIPAMGGIGSVVSGVRRTNVMVGTRGLDILADFTDIRVFDEWPAASTSAVNVVTDVAALDTQAVKFSYDVSAQNYTGIVGKDLLVTTHDVSRYKTINYRIRTDVAVGGGPIRVVFELKSLGEVKGNVLVSGITDAYQDIMFPLYCDGGVIDEVTLVVPQDADPDGFGNIYIDELFLDEQEYVPALLPVVPDEKAKTMSDIALLDTVESDMALYFYNETIGSYGFVKDANNSEFSSIAATGFGLATLAILGDRYDVNDTHWNAVSYDDAKDRAITILTQLKAMQGNQDTNSAEYGTHGCFYHFITGDGKRIGTSEVSTVDTAILVIGALVAGEYFEGAVKTLADEIYANIDWTFFLNATTYQYHMGWKPESSRDYLMSTGGGFISNATYNMYTDEIFLISFLALGTHSNSADVLNSCFAFSRDKKSYKMKQGDHVGETVDVVSSYFGAMFTYLYAHCFFDFETLGEDKPGNVPALAITEPINWWENSVNAIRANKDFCHDRSKYFPYSMDDGKSWGISACQLPSGRYEGLFGAPPTSNGPGHDGTVAVTMPICALPFYKDSEVLGLEDNEGFKAIDYYYRHFKSDLYGTYGFYGSYNHKGEFSSTYLGIDVGSALLLLENYRTGFVWDQVKKNQKLSAALDQVFQESFNWVDVTVKNISDEQLAAAIDFGNADADAPLVQGLQFLDISFNFGSANSAIAIYTNNTASETFAYSGSGNPAGLVGNIDPAQAAPLRWVVYPVVQGTSYSFPIDMNASGIMHDVKTFLFDTSVALADRTIVSGDGLLASYPVSGRATTASSVYVYCAVDYEGLDSQKYSTDTLSIEMYQKS